VKRTLNESPYTSAVATTLRRDAIARGLMKFFQGIGRLRLFGAMDTLKKLSDRSHRFARAIAGPVARLRLEAFAAANRPFSRQALQAASTSHAVGAPSDLQKGGSHRRARQNLPIASAIT